MASIVIAKMDENSRVFLVYNIENGTTEIMRKSLLCNIKCMNYKYQYGNIEYTQGKTDSRVPLKDTLDCSHFCYVLYKVKDSKGTNIGYKVLDINKGIITILDLGLRDAVLLIDNSICVNAKVVRENKKVFISAFKNKFETITYNIKQDNKECDISHIIANTNKKYTDTYNSVQKLSTDGLCETYNKVAELDTEDKLKLDFIQKRLKKKKPLSGQLRRAMAICITMTVIGGVSIAGYSKPLFNKSSVEISVTNKQAPVDATSTIVRILNSDKIVTKFEGDTGKIVIDGLEVANINSVYSNGVDIVTITDLDNNIIATNKSDSIYATEHGVYRVDKDKRVLKYKFDTGLANLIKYLNICNKDGKQIARVKTSNYLNEMRLKIIDDNEEIIYKISCSKYNNKSFKIEKGNVKSDVDMIDALLISSTFNTHLDDIKYE